MAREVEVAVGGTIDRKAEVCDQCDEAMLFLCPDDVPVAVFCQNFECPLFLVEVAL